MSSRDARSQAEVRNTAPRELPPLPGPEPIQTVPKPVAAPKPVNRPSASRNAIIHSVLQRRNPVLPLIRNIGLEIGDIVADYQVGAHSGVLFLSLKYHRLHPEYIFGRIEKMRNMYNLRILLILCDVAEHEEPIRELSKVAIANDLTTIVAVSNEEAAQYLTAYKLYEHKSAETLKERVRQSYPDQLEHVLTSGRKVNKANAETLAATFGSFANMARQSSAVLTGVKGIGPTKTLSLFRAFNEPFVAGRKLAAPTAGGTLAARSAGSMNPPSEVVDVEDDVVDEAGEEAEQEYGLPPNEDDIRHSPEMVPEGSAPHSPAQQRPPTPRRPDDTGPSRSPSVEPDEEHTATKEVWNDPLADDSEEDEDERPAKRPRV